jgi:hypothetical protein
MPKNYKDADRRAIFNKKRNEGIAHFRSLLDKHHWQYAQSDVRRTYEAGLEEERIIKELAASNYTYNLMYQAKKKKVFKNV